MSWTRRCVRSLALWLPLVLLAPALLASCEYLGEERTGAPSPGATATYAAAQSPSLLVTQTATSAVPPGSSTPRPALTWHAIETLVPLGAELKTPFEPDHAAFEEYYRGGAAECINLCRSGPALWRIYVVNKGGESRLLYEGGRWIKAMRWRDDRSLQFDYATRMSVDSGDPGGRYVFEVLGRSLLEVASGVDSELPTQLFLWPRSGMPLVQIRHYVGVESQRHVMGIYRMQSREARVLGEGVWSLNEADEPVWSETSNTVQLGAWSFDLDRGRAAPPSPLGPQVNEWKIATEKASPDGRFKAITKLDSRDCLLLTLADLQTAQEAEVKIPTVCGLIPIWLSRGQLIVATALCCNPFLLGMVYLVDPVTLTVRTVGELESYLRPVVSPTRDQFVLLGLKPQLTVYDEDGKLLRSYQLPDGYQPYELQWSPDGASFAFILGPANWGRTRDYPLVPLPPPR